MNSPIEIPLTPEQWDAARNQSKQKFDLSLEQDGGQMILPFRMGYVFAVYTYSANVLSVSVQEKPFLMSMGAIRSKLMELTGEER